MFSRLAFLGFTVLCCATLFAQRSAAPEPYTDDDAYDVYDVLLPQDSSTDTLVIQQQTSGPLSNDGPASFGPENCLTPAAASEFKEVIQDYNRRNQKQWLLQRKFSISRPYEIIDSGTISTMFKQSDGWDKFYERFPNSGGLYDMSAVGFSGDKTKAIVYFGNGCHWLCGEWSFHLLRKVHGKWEETKGVTCQTVS